MTSIIDRAQGPSTGSGTQGGSDPQNADAALIARAPRRRISPERISAALTLLVIAGLAITSLIDLDITFAGVAGSLDSAQNFFARVGGLSFPEPGELLQLTVLTVGLVLTGTLLAAVLSVPIAYLAASNTTPHPAARAVARFIGVFTRALPDVVLAMVFVLMFSLGTLPGILAIGIHSIGMISKMFADAIEQIDEGPRLAIRAAGGTRMQEFVTGVLPQVLPSWVATVLHRNDINLRGSVVLGYVGVAGLGLEMSHAFKSLDYGLGLGIALVIFLLCVVMEIVSSAVRVAMLGEKDAGRGAFVKLFSRRALRRAQGPSTMQGPSNAQQAKTTSTPAFASVEQALHRPWTAARVRDTAAGWIAAAAVAASIVVSDIVWEDLLTFWGKLPAVAAQFWPPAFGNYGFEVIAGAMLDTIRIALAATLITLVLSLVIGSLAARNVAPNRGVRGGFRMLLVIIRGIPELILAIVLIIITGLGPQAGVIALAFGGIGLLGSSSPTPSRRCRAARSGRCWPPEPPACRCTRGPRSRRAHAP